MTISMTRKQSITFLLGLSIVDRCIPLLSKSLRSTTVPLYFFRIISHSFPAYEPVPKLSFCKYSPQISIPYSSEVLFNWFNDVSSSSTIAFNASEPLELIPCSDYSPVHYFRRPFSSEDLAPTGFGDTVDLLLKFVFTMHQVLNLSLAARVSL